ncbi:hypothetical protein CEXT_205271 [Caerostris extrusa]|uniref:Transmembrane protein n=1 Tax=Caerostris extrusa TaxID=172846 RepID=A0AAV4RVB2_CAEEX|nr:hypothetical protein CEXT_205271 [Caerostris extrusa]
MAEFSGFHEPDFRRRQLDPHLSVQFFLLVLLLSYLFSFFFFLLLKIDFGSLRIQYVTLRWTLLVSNGLSLEGSSDFECSEISALGRPTPIVFAFS